MEATYVLFVLLLKVLSRVNKKKHSLNWKLSHFAYLALVGGKIEISYFLLKSIVMLISSVILIKIYILTYIVWNNDFIFVEYRLAPPTPDIE